MVPSTDGGVIVCSYDSNGDSPLIIPEIIEVSHFYPCFNAWKTTDKGLNLIGDVKIDAAMKAGA